MNRNVMQAAAGFLAAFAFGLILAAAAGWQDSTLRLILHYLT